MPEPRVYLQSATVSGGGRVRINRGTTGGGYTVVL